MFSSQTVVELVKALAKALLVGGVAVWVIWRYHDDMLGLMHVAPSAALTRALTIVAICCALIVASLAVIVALDVPWQIWSHLKKLRMSKEDVRQEHKGKRGRPARQGAHPPAAAPGRAPPHDGRRAQGGRGGDQPHALCRGAAVRRIEERRAARAGQGTGLIAAKIRELAAEHKIPTLEAPPLARALHQHVELGQEIPAELYTAVAEVLAWVFQLRSWRAGWGPSRPRRPACLCRPRWTRKPRPQLKESKE